MPGGIRIVAGDTSSSAGSPGTEILLINFPLLVHHKGHDTGLAPFSRPRDQRKASDHISIDHIVVFATGGMLSLACEYFEEVAVVWNRIVREDLCFPSITLGARLADQRP